jgi:hypothetical protein
MRVIDKGKTCRMERAKIYRYMDAKNEEETTTTTTMTMILSNHEGMKGQRSHLLSQLTVTEIGK